MLVGDAAFASTRASEPQVASRREQSCPHRLGNPCRKMPFGPRRKQGERVFFRASGHLAGHVFLQGAVDHACSPRSRTWCCTAPRPHAPLPPHAVSSQPPPPAPCIPPFLLCSRLSLLSQLLLSASLEQRPRCFSSPTAGETWRDAHPGEDAHLAPPRTWERTLSPSQRRDTPNDLPYQSPQVHFTSLSSRLKGKAGIR